MKIQKLIQKQARQILYLFRFGFTLKHVLETKLEKIDGLSRRLYQKVGIENDNENQIKTRRKDKEVVKVVEMKKTGVKVSRENKQEIEEELVLKEEKIYIPRNEKLRLEIIQLYYNILIARHKRRRNTMELVDRSNKECRKVCRQV